MSLLPFIFGYLPQNLIGIIGPLSLIIVGYFVERNFVGRVATFTNTIAVNVAFYGKDLSSLGFWETPLVIYLDIGIVMGIVSIISYYLLRSLNSIFYIISWAYCSIIVGIITIASLSVPYFPTLEFPIEFLDSSFVPFT